MVKYANIAGDTLRGIINRINILWRAIFTTDDITPIMNTDTNASGVASTTSAGSTGEQAEDTLKKAKLAAFKL